MTIIFRHVLVLFSLSLCFSFCPTLTHADDTNPMVVSVELGQVSSTPDTVEVVPLHITNDTPVEESIRTSKASDTTEQNVDSKVENEDAATNFTIESSQSAVIYYDQIELVGSSGGGGTYANPHAAISLNGVSQSYDNNGNLASTSAGLLNTWNYQNRLTQSGGAGTPTTTYLYDETGQRTQKVSGGVTTHYPFPLYEAQGATTTKHVYVGDTLVATIQSDTPSPKTYYNHQDHLGSTNVVSTPDGYLDHELSYFPFGSMRVDNQYGELDQTNRFTSQPFDESTGLNYLGQRYQNGAQGRFVSQDPVFQSVGNQSLLEEKTGIVLDTYLRNPQTHNAYSYVANNPVNYADKGGEYLQYFFALFMPTVVYSPDVGEESYTDMNLESGIMLAGLISPSGKYGSFSGGMFRSLLMNTVKAPTVTVTKSGLEHVISRHTVQGKQFVAGATSYFDEGVDVGNLLRQSSSVRAQLNNRGAYERVFDTGKKIGFDVQTGKTTSVMTVVTDKKGNLITAHPGAPFKKKKGE